MKKNTTERKLLRILWYSFYTKSSSVGVIRDTILHIFSLVMSIVFKLNPNHESSKWNHRTSYRDESL